MSISTSLTFFNPHFLLLLWYSALLFTFFPLAATLFFSPTLWLGCFFDFGSDFFGGFADLGCGMEGVDWQFFGSIDD